MQIFVKSLTGKTITLDVEQVIQLKMSKVKFKIKKVFPLTNNDLSLLESN